MNAPQPSKTNRWLILVAIVVIVSIIGIILSYVIGFEKATPEIPKQTPTSPSPPAATMIKPQANTPVTENTPPAADSIINASLLTAPVPQEEALVREEMDTLKDQQTQLHDQKVMLHQQLKDSDQLVEMKQKYLADLQSQMDKTSV